MNHQPSFSDAVPTPSQSLNNSFTHCTMLKRLPKRIAEEDGGKVSNAKTEMISKKYVVDSDDDEVTHIFAYPHGLIHLFGYLLAYLIIRLFIFLLG